MLARSLTRLNGAVDGWLLAPEVNAAGRMGLYRILFCAFYLWFLSYQFAGNLSGLPEVHHLPTLLIEPLPKEVLPAGFFEVLESSLVAALLVLMIGFRVRAATAAVLVLGALYEAFYMSIDPEKATVMLAFHIPLFMLIVGRWGSTYSLDSLLSRRAGRPPVEPSDSSGSYFLAARAVLVVLAFLFFSAAVAKVAFGGTWLERPELLSIVMIEHNIESAVLDIPVNPLAPAIATNAAGYFALAYSTLLFEALFFLGLFDRDLRRLLLAMALIFHSISALWLGITFTPVLITYGLFVDWQALRERVWPRRIALPRAVPSSAFILATLALGVAAATLWNLGSGLRGVANIGGLLDWRTIFYPVLPLALIWFGVAARDVVRRVLRPTRLAGGRPATG